VDFSTQLNTFLLITVTGILLGVLFDTYRVLRGVFRPQWLITSVADLLYWLVAAGIAFLALMLGNWGELRFYVFIAMIAGVSVYYRLASRSVIKLIVSLLKLLVRTWRTINKVFVFTVAKPARFVIRTSLLPFRYLGKKFSAWCKKRFPPPPPPEELPPQ
jgi:spore cortex biosynthesis protein YabQ